MSTEHEGVVVDADDSWFHTGDEAEIAAEKIEALRKEQQNRAFRWYIPKNKREPSELTFLDSDRSPFGYKLPFSYLEHQVDMGKHQGGWKNWFTCLGKTCLICKGGNQPYLATAYTIIDHGKWTDNSGNAHVDEVKLFVCKTQVQKQLVRLAKVKDGLRGWRIEVQRTGDKAANTGDSFLPLERTDPGEGQQPFDYKVLFKPKSKDEIQEFFGGDMGSSSDDNVRF